MEQITHRLTDMLDTARRAFTNTSFDPEGRGTRTLAEFEQELNSDLKWFEQAAATGEKCDRLPAIIERYITNYRRYLAAWLGSEANCASSFVVGPSNFPTARMQKRNTWARNHYNHFRDWRRRAYKAIEKALKKEVTAEGELMAVERKLQAYEARHAKMKAANVIIRRYKNANEYPPQLVEELKALGIEERERVRIIKGDYGKPGFPGWELTNSNANIKRLQERVKYLREKSGKKGNPGFYKEYEDFAVKENREIDRVQIIFKSKPCEEIRALLRHHAFIYSSKNKANQRKLTPFALATVVRLAKEIDAMLSPTATDDV